MTTARMKRKYISNKIDYNLNIICIYIIDIDKRMRTISNPDEFRKNVSEKLDSERGQHKKGCQEVGQSAFRANLC